MELGKEAEMLGNSMDSKDVKKETTPVFELEKSNSSGAGKEAQRADILETQKKLEAIYAQTEQGLNSAREKLGLKTPERLDESLGRIKEAIENNNWKLKELENIQEEEEALEKEAAEASVSQEKKKVILEKEAGGSVEKKKNVKREDGSQPKKPLREPENFFAPEKSPEIDENRERVKQNTEKIKEALGKITEALQRSRERDWAVKKAIIEKDDLAGKERTSHEKGGETSHKKEFLEK